MVRARNQVSGFRFQGTEIKDRGSGNRKQEIGNRKEEKGIRD